MIYMNLMSIMCADAQGQERILAFFLEVTCPKSPRNRKKHITGTAMLSAILSECGVVAVSYTHLTLPTNSLV